MIHVRTLLALIVLLTSVMAAILTLNAFSARSLLSQAGFTYEADISKLNLSFPTFAPISIAPTVASIVIGLWWDQLDMTFRTLQPYISMSQRPTSISAGAGLTYKSKTWIGAAIKAARHRHWVLLMVAVGSTLTQVLTVSMSALFERRSTPTTQQISLPQNLKIRHDPFVTKVDVILGNNKRWGYSQDVLDELYLDARENWLYGAGIQHSFNDSQLPWSSEGWSFLPVDLTHISNSTASQGQQNSYSSPAIASANVSLQVPAIRARLECKPIEEVSNASSWLEPVDLTDDKSILADDVARLKRTGGLQLYKLPVGIFINSSSETTTFSSPNYEACCSNGTIEQQHRSVLGYWSAALVRPPYDKVSWPMSVVPKWVVGKPISITDTNGHEALYFREEPRMQAANCRPIIETTEANVVVDAQSGAVLSRKVKTPIEPMNSAWDDAFTPHEVSGHASQLANNSYVGPLNVTTSFGILFLGSLLGSANRGSDSNAFVFRDKEYGLDMDIMTNTMYVMANKNAEALLDYTTFVESADRTFQAFFQQFVNSGLSLKQGGFTYQSVDDRSIEDLSRPIYTNGTVISKRETVSTQSISASVSTRIRVLHMNVVATYLAIAVLIWLTGTVFVIISLQRKYTSSMIRDVQLIADMLVLIAGSNRFLELLHERGIALKKDPDIQTMLGWFKDSDGEVRWGIEVLGGPDPVQWVDAPETGNHTREKNSIEFGRLLQWRKA